MPLLQLCLLCTLLFVVSPLCELCGQTRTATGAHALALPLPGERTLRLLSPTLLEITLITLSPPGAGAAPPELALKLKTLEVAVDGQPAKIAATGWKRRAVYAPLARRDLRVGTQFYLQLAEPIALASEPRNIVVYEPAAGGNRAFDALTVRADPRRLSPVIHVNQEGYMPSLPKKAMLGYSLGDLGELKISAATGFTLIDAQSGQEVFHGVLEPRRDGGHSATPSPYQGVLVADFSAFRTPGEYRLAVDGLGVSLPFLVDEGIAMGFARTYALGLHGQRCGCANTLPFTRFVHTACHLAPAQIPSPQSAAQFRFTWAKIKSYASEPSPDLPPQIAPALGSESAQRFPFVRKGSIDVSGGHHDAGDYSKYTINSTALIHHLMFTVDAVPGLAQLDNLGGPESGDGIPDILQEAKWEADFLAKLQDADGGFYFLVYPKTREYESDVLPEKGDPQVLWPKNTSVTAAAVAALAQCASSPSMRKHYPEAAAKYLKQAEHGWRFLMDAFVQHGRAGAYQKITFYGDRYRDEDELAWAACELFLATGDPAYHAQLMESLPKPADPATFRWGWWRLSDAWGNAIRSYAFAARSGRLPREKLDARYLAACEEQIVLAGDDVVSWSAQNAYATPFPLPTKRVRGGGWYFSLDQASDAAAAWLIEPKPIYIETLVGAMNYEAGTNPVNVSYLTGLGVKRQREVVSQYAQNDERVFAPSGIPLGNIQAGYSHSPTYGTELRELAHPDDGGSYAIYDRWSDAFNVTTEFITVNQARGFLSSILLATRTTAIARAWKPVPAKIIGAIGAKGATLHVEVPGEDLAQARIVWEARNQEPAFGATYAVAPRGNGDGWVEAEIAWADGRRAFASRTFKATNVEFIWLDDELPDGATADLKDGPWEWGAASPAPQSGALTHYFEHASGNLHEHSFNGATARLAVGVGDTLTAWVFLDAKQPPKQIMLSWHAKGGWEHRAYWGANTITYGKNNSPGRHRAGNLPPTGKWVKLTIPAKAVGLENMDVDGMSFAHVEGRAVWDSVGRTSGKK